MLIDNHDRVINYLRLAVTDRCNLRCNYCMPEEGIDFASNSRLLSIGELTELSKILVGMGIDKIRLTGGEPFVRKDLMVLIRELSAMEGLNDISVTTNATLIGQHIDELKSLGLQNINLSMDAVNKETFERITRRNQFETVYENLIKLVTNDFNVRVNFIVLQDQNIQDIYDVLELTKEYPLSIRFLEEMPFNGGTKTFDALHWDHRRILEYVRDRYPDIEKMKSPPTSTSVNYRIPGHKGTFGLIPSFSRTFCGSCNRLRISATGDVITCLYGKPRMNLRDLIRSGAGKEAVEQHIRAAVGSRAKNGFEEQRKYIGVFNNSMTSIGG